LLYFPPGKFKGDKNSVNDPVTNVITFGGQLVLLLGLQTQPQFRPTHLQHTQPPPTGTTKSLSPD